MPSSATGPLASWTSTRWADKIRRGGVPDQPWWLLTQDDDKIAFCGFSIYALTGPS
jgi:hypothetical protein